MTDLNIMMALISEVAMFWEKQSSGNNTSLNISARNRIVHIWFGRRVLDGRKIEELTLEESLCFKHRLESRLEIKFKEAETLTVIRLAWFNKYLQCG